MTVVSGRARINDVARWRLGGVRRVLPCPGELPFKFRDPLVLPLLADVKNTLLGESAELSDIYRLMLAQESGDWTTLSRLADAFSTSPGRFSQLYFDAVKWSQNLLAV